MKESYVVQIYRRDAADPARLTVTVERIGDGATQSFGRMEELWTFLSAESPPAGERRQGGARAAGEPAAGDI